MGLVFLSNDEARQLSADLRNGDHPHLRARRRIFGLYAAACSALGVIALYQIGISKRLPRIPLPAMNAEKVNASPEAYSKLSTPDAVLGIASYAATMTLAAMGAPERASRHPLLPLGMAAKMAADTANAGWLAVSEWRKNRALCSWCLLAAGATAAALPYALGETRAAWKELRRRTAR